MAMILLPMCKNYVPISLSPIFVTMRHWTGAYNSSEVKVWLGENKTTMGDHFANYYISVKNNMLSNNSTSTGDHLEILSICMHLLADPKFLGLQLDKRKRLCRVLVDMCVLFLCAHVFAEWGILIFKGFFLTLKWLSLKVYGLS